MTEHKTPVFKGKAGGKEAIVKFRTTIEQKQRWVDAINTLGVNDFARYARKTLDEALQRDLEAFNKANKKDG
jgi:hypothetical protein